MQIPKSLLQSVDAQSVNYGLLIHDQLHQQFKNITTQKAISLTRIRVIH